MKTETVLNVGSLRENVRRLPTFRHEGVKDQHIALAEPHLKFWGKSLEDAKGYQFSKYMAGDAAYAKKYEREARLLTAVMMTNAMLNVSAKEAMTAGADLPTFTTRVMLLIKRVYPALYATQLFGVLPMSQPTGRLHFKDYQYDDNFGGTTPTIAQGQRTDDTPKTKFNPDYYKVSELAQGRKLKLVYSNLDFSESSYRVLADISDQFRDDIQNVYNDDAESSSYDHMTQEMGRVVDQTMIAAVKNNVPAGNSKTWHSAPDGTTAGEPNYASLDPVNRKYWDETLWNAIQDTITAIRTTRQYDPSSSDPDWMVCDPTFATRLWKLTTFRPIVKSPTDVQLAFGALRDIGSFDVMGLRVLVNPMMDTDVAYFGRKPVAPGDPGIYFAPYVPMQVLKPHYDTDTGLETIGVRSRFGVVQPNTGSNAASSQLADIYGKLTVTAA